MRIAILGATSQIAKDLVLSFATQNSYELVLYARRPNAVSLWLASINLQGRYLVAEFSEFSTGEHFDAIFNFVGVGDPAQAIVMGAEIFDVTLKYDQLALEYLRQHPLCRYLFMSSGAVYGSIFNYPANEHIPATFPINDIRPQHWYALAKMYAECRHRSMENLSIIDIRVFNYFSHTQDMKARYLIADIIRAINENAVLKTSSEYIVRDYLNPIDFFALVMSALMAKPCNLALDCYSRAPIDKPALLELMQENFGLKYETVQTTASVNATGNKSHYYSLNTKAKIFGYEPTLTSHEGIIKESSIMLSNLYK